ncbi:MAG: hypothetical protein MI740_10610 [Halanaerobiales bacterium]|nr:hypothetical protein [Halanaerobiales bacterium]
MSKFIKSIMYRFYNKETYLDFDEKTSPKHDDISFQEFVNRAIDDYLAGKYNPKKD